MSELMLHLLAEPDLQKRVDSFRKAAVGFEVTASPRCQAGYVQDVDQAWIYFERAFGEAVALNQEIAAQSAYGGVKEPTTRDYLVAALDHLEPQVGL